MKIDTHPRGKLSQWCIVIGVLGFLSVFQERLNVGILGRIKRSLAPSLEQRIKDEATEKVERLKRLTQTGASKEEIEKYIDSMSRSTEFYEILGELKESAPTAIFLAFLDEEKEEDKESFKVAYERCWKRFTRAQEDADRFFGNTVMRSWVIARSIKERAKTLTWEQIDSMMGDNSGWHNCFRSKDWWIVPWSFAIADEVQEREGAGSCKKAEFDAMWDELSKKETVDAFLDTLGKEQVAYYRCTD